MPDKLKEMQEVFYAEAKKYNVFPLDNSTLARFLTPRPSTTAGRKVFEYSGELTGVPPACAPNIMAKDFIIEAQVEIPEGGAEGMIVTEGGRFGGYGLFLSKGIEGIGRGHVVFLYNLLDLKRTAWEGPELKPGKHTIRFDFKYDGPGFGKGGTGELFVDGKSVAKKKLENTTPVMFPEDEDFDVGQDTRTGVAMIEYRYDCPFKFTGKILKLRFDLGPAQYTAAGYKAASRTSRPRERLVSMNRPDADDSYCDRRGRSGYRRGVAGCSVARWAVVVRRGTYRRRHTGARVTGIALIALGVACWPGRTALCGMLIYSAAVTLYLSVSRHPRRLGRAALVAGGRVARSPDAASRARLVQATRGQSNITNPVDILSPSSIPFRTRHACHHSCRGSRVGCGVPHSPKGP